MGEVPLFTADLSVAEGSFIPKPVQPIICFGIIEVEQHCLIMARCCICPLEGKRIC